MNNNEDVVIDEELYSRQLYVIGVDAMKKMMQTKVLIVGLDGLGQEIAKNLCLAGIKNVDICDKSLVKDKDMCSGFYFTNRTLGIAKDLAVLENLRSLNKYVKVDVVPEMFATVNQELNINEASCKEYNVIVSVNQDIKFNLELSGWCHSRNVKFLMANVSGLFSQVFADFGEHTCLDKNGEPASSGGINDITTEGLLTIADGSRHSLEDGDIVKIDSQQSYKVQVVSRYQLRLMNYAEGMKVGGDFEQVKEPIQLKFKSLRECLSSDVNNYILTFGNENRVKIIHDCFIDNITSDIYNNKGLVEQFIKTKGTLIAPMCSIIGGFAAQEVLKAVTSKFMPLQQFFYFDSADAYTGTTKFAKESANDSSDTLDIGRYHDMQVIFGKEGFDKIMKTSIFLVGAGAIGCENLKNFVVSGIGCKAKISVADMDSIEQSNLNRQFLFRESDVSRMKAEAAVEQVKRLNEEYSGKLDFYNSAVGTENEEMFSDTLLSSFDVFSNALDNVEARGYMDGRSIRLRKPMFDAGTLGTKGHVQSVIPFVSESYGSSSDSVESSIPMCTVKSYPNNIEHTIEWALAEFKRRFNEEVQTVENIASLKKNQPKEEILSPKAIHNSGLNNPNEVDEKNPIIGDENDDEDELYDQAPRNVEGCIKKALALFVRLFSTNIQTLLSTFPADYITKDGLPFWSPPKRPPTPISFNINDKLHILFVECCSNLYATCFNIRKIERREIFEYLENLLSLREPNPIHFDDKDVALENLNTLEFDKDSWHIDFVFASANLRARNYKIKEQSKHFIRGIAGKIIPAIATTTAVVSGLSTLEIIKYILFVKDSIQKTSIASEVDVLHEPVTVEQPTKRISIDNSPSKQSSNESFEKDSQIYEQNTNNSSDGNLSTGPGLKNLYEESTPCKNAFLDLSLPFLGLTDLIKPKEHKYEANGKIIKYDLWSRIEIPDSSLRSFLEKLKGHLGKSVSMASIGSRVIYWDCSDKYASNLDKNLSDLCSRKSGQLMEYVDILLDDETESENVAVIFN